MHSLNRITLIGRVGKDPVIKELDNKRTVCNLSLVTAEYYKDKNNKSVEKVTWHSLTLWTPLAEIATKLVRKGMKIYVDGKVKNNNFKTTEGIEYRTYDIEVENLLVLGNTTKNEKRNDN